MANATPEKLYMQLSASELAAIIMKGEFSARTEDNATCCLQNV